MTADFERISQVIEDWELDYHLGNVVKHTGLAHLSKEQGHYRAHLDEARSHLERAIELAESREEPEAPTAQSIRAAQDRVVFESTADNDEDLVEYTAPVRKLHRRAGRRVEA